MKHSTESRHLDWNIRTVVAIDNPADSKPGDPDRYFVRGIAEIAHDGDRFGYTSDQAQTVDTDHFTDERLAARYHGEATSRLWQAIELLKI